MEVATSGLPPKARPWTLGLTGAAAHVGLAFMIGGLASGTGTFPAPPEPIPRGVALFLLLALPGVIGALGAVSGDTALLAAAAVLAAAASVIGFSGITLIFLMPALMFAVAAGKDADQAPRPRRPVVVSAAIVFIGGAVVLAAVQRLGIFVLPLIVVLVLALGVLGQRRRRMGLGGAAATLLIVLAGVAAGWSLLALTETRCWEAHQTPNGIEYRSVPETSTHVFPAETNIVASGCDGGALTPRGTGIAVALGLAALGVAVVRASSP